MSLIFSNGISLLFKSEKGEVFPGISGVCFEGTPLRNDQLPWIFYTESEGPDGAWRFEEFRLRDIEKNDETAVLTLTSVGRWLPRVQQADAMGDARIKTRRMQVPTATFHWRFRALTERLWEKEWTGLSMQLEIESPGWPIHWVIEDTTWEIGGSAAGCVLIQQDISTIDLEQKVRADSSFSTIEKFHTETEEAWGGNYPMDMLPRAAGAAICDFQTKGDLALCLYAGKPGLTRARLQKFSDENVIHYTDRPFIVRAERALFPERRLLVYRHASPLPSHESRNLWLDCFTHVRKTILDSYGFQLEIPRPSLHAHLWDDDLKALGKAWIQPLQDALPAFKKLGYEQVFTHGVWESITSDPHPPESGNICCPYEFRFAEAFGGAEGMRQLVKAAQASGIDLFQWFSFHLSRHAPAWKEHPDWVLHEANGDPWDGNYGSLWSGRIRSGYGDWFFSAIKRVREETGMAGIFWDSYQNLGVTCIDWKSPDRAPQAEEIWRMQAELQRLGYKQKCEIVTIFGVSMVGMYGFEADSFRRRLWADTVRNDDAFALLDTSAGFFTSSDPFNRDQISPEKYFWLAAHRSIPALSVRPWVFPTDSTRQDSSLPGGALAREYARINHLYIEVLPRMARLWVQPGGDWVLWLDAENHPAIAWAFRETVIPFRGTVREVETKKMWRTETEVVLVSGGVYELIPTVSGDRESL